MIPTGARKKTLPTFASIYNCDQTSIMKLNRSDIRVPMTDEHPAAVLSIVTSAFTPNTGKFVNNCKQHHLLH